jgi:hypothetical protein
MTESLLEADTSGAPDTVDAHAQGSELGDTQRPSEIPEKFWDEELGQIRTDGLVKSYIELERKLGGLSEDSPPATPEDYQINVDNELLASDPEVNKRLHEAGFTQEQAQVVYDIAAERFPPMIAEVASVFEAETQLGNLVRHFGGEERWRETARQIEAWGQSRLPKPVFEALSTTCDGVLAIHRMMSGDEPGLLHQGAAGDGMPTEAELKRIMRDPAYWRDQDSALVEKVRTGFRNLYREEG